MNSGLGFRFIAMTEAELDCETPSDEEANLYFKVIKTISMKVKKSETIKKLKSMYREKEGISENLQALFFRGDLLRDSQRITHYGIAGNSTIHIVHQEAPGIKLYVKFPSDEKTLEIIVKNSNTIANIKSIIHKEEGIDSEEYVIYHSGKCLDKFEVRSTLTVPAVKKIVESLTGFPSEYWNLYKSGKELEDETLAHYGIKENDTLLMAADEFYIKVHTSTGRVLYLQVTGERK